MKSEQSATALEGRVRAFIGREIGLGTVSEGAGREESAHVYVALSGGADSTALLLIMKKLGYAVHALHCNFHLRGTESDRDQAFAEELCRQNGVPLTVRHFQTEAEARRRGVSIEMAARDLRYEWFRSLSGSPVAVGHHLDDQAETLLLNLLRGTGLRGMAAMPPRHGCIIRPLLCLSREEILLYLEERGQAYVTDSSNLVPCTVRNRLRLEVIPLLRSINAKAVGHLALACENVRHSIHYYIKGAEAAFAESGITPAAFPLSALGRGPLLHEWLYGKGFNRVQEAEMLGAAEKPVGRVWRSATHVVVRDRVALLLAPLSEAVPPPSLRQELVGAVGETGPDIAYFDADLLTAPIVVRPVREGDAFVPFGMKGRKLVSDFLTDRKVSRLGRERQFVATCGDDIVWLIGHRSDNRFRVTDTTVRILRLTVEPWSGTKEEE